MAIDILTHALAIIFDDKVSGISYSGISLMWKALYGHASAGSC